MSPVIESTWWKKKDQMNKKKKKMKSGAFINPFSGCCKHFLAKLLQKGISLSHTETGRKATEHRFL